MSVFGDISFKPNKNLKNLTFVKKRIPTVSKCCKKC